MLHLCPSCNRTQPCPFMNSLWTVGACPTAHTPLPGDRNRSPGGPHRFKNAVCLAFWAAFASLRLWTHWRPLPPPDLRLLCSRSPGPVHRLTSLPQARAVPAGSGSLFPQEPPQQGLSSCVPDSCRPPPLRSPHTPGGFNASDLWPVCLLLSKLPRAFCLLGKVPAYSLRHRYNLSHLPPPGVHLTLFIYFHRLI